MRKHPITPTMAPVTSSHVEAIGYDAPSKTLHVKFKGGATYQYGGVPEQRHVALVQAESKGNFLRKEIYPHHVGKKLEEKK